MRSALDVSRNRGLNRQQNGEIMKIILLFLTLCIKLFADSTCFELDSNTIALWRFDETSGDTAYDASKNKNHAILNNASWAPGKFGSAIELNGINADAIVKLSSSLTSFTNKITIEAIVYPFRLNNTWHHILSSHGDYTLSFYYGRPAFQINSQWWTPNNYLADTMKWIKIAAQYTGKKQQIYIDDSLVCEKDFSNTIEYVDNYDLRIGGDIDYQVEGFLFNGKIDEIRISNCIRYDTTSNKPPVFTSIPDSITYEGRRYTYIVKAFDPEHSSVSYSLLSNLDHLSLNDDTLLFFPDTNQVGKNEIIIKATDQNNISSIQKFNLEVKRRNSQITFLSLFPLGDTSIVEKETLILSGLANSMNPQAVLSYSWLINGIVKSNTPQCTLATNYSSAGICSVKVTVFDGSEFKDNYWKITILNKPISPLPLLPTDGASARGNTFFSWHLEDPDFDSTSVRYRIQFFKGLQKNILVKMVENISTDSIMLGNLVGPNDFDSGTIYNWRVAAYDPSGDSTPYSTLRSFYFIEYGNISIENRLTEIPDRICLYQNDPNPFNPSTRIRFSIPSRINTDCIALPRNAAISIYSMTGIKIKEFLFPTNHSGNHEVVWDARDNAGQLCPNGLYIYRLQAGEYKKTLKMTLLK